jgi:hypothetical protein
MAYEHLIVERHGPVGWLINNRPEQLNAMNAHMRDEFADAWKELDEDPAESADHGGAEESVVLHAQDHLDALDHLLGLRLSVISRDAVRPKRVRAAFLDAGRDEVGARDQPVDRRVGGIERERGVVGTDLAVDGAAELVP